ncbi:MAG: hypothetical protein KAJ01_02965 [Candidatus Hydrogenedentes bacterium]|nr:hypothetical protein [Candidatus Hydrogenedentota bacterium]
MSERGQICKGERAMKRASSPHMAATGASRLVAVALGILCGSLLLLSAYADAMSARAPAAPTTYSAARARTARQVQRAASVYELDSPVQLEVRIVKIELSSPWDVTWQWRFPRELFSPPAEETGAESSAEMKPEGFAGVLQSLQKFGMTTVLHSGVCLLTGNEATYVYSGRRVPVRQTRPTGEGETIYSAVEYRDLGHKLIVNLDGLDARGRICFSYDIDVSYVDDETGGADEAPSFASFNTQARGKVKDGQTLVIQNFDRSTALLIFLTPHIVK